jgi:hypothetical protein
MYPCSSSFHMALHAENCLFCWCRQNENSIVQACVLANTYKLLSALQSWHKRIIRITGRKYEVMGNRSLSTSCKEKENGRKGDTCLAFSNSASLRTDHGEKVSLRWQRQILARMNSLCYISCMFRGIVVVASEVGTRDKPQMIFFVCFSANCIDTFFAGWVQQGNTSSLDTHYFFFFFLSPCSSRWF